MARMMRSSSTSPGHDVVGLDRAAVADDGDRVGDRGDLVELVGDHDLGDALGLQATHQVQQVRGVVLVEGGGGLVEDEQLDVLGQGLGDLDQLLLAHAECLDRGVGVDLQADAGQQVERLERGRPRQSISSPGDHSRSRGRCSP